MILLPEQTHHPRVDPAWAVNSEFVVYSAQVDGNLEISGHTIASPAVVFNEVLPRIPHRLACPRLLRRHDRSEEQPRLSGEGRPTRGPERCHRTLRNASDLRQNGALYRQRDGGPKLKLIPTSNDEFGIEGIPAARVRFVRDANGRIAELHGLNREGVWEKSARA